MAGQWSFRIDQGATFQRRLTWADANGVPVPLLDLTTANGRITLTSPGVIDLLVAAADTAVLSFASCVHDLAVTDPAQTPPVVTRLLEGVAWLSPGVSR